MISSLHGPFDDRIYWKEALSLRKYGFEVIHLCIGRQRRDFISDEGIRIIEIKKARFSRNPYLDILFRMITGRTGIMKELLTVCAALQAHVYHFHDQQINKIGKRLGDLPQRPRIIYDVHEDYHDQIITYHPSGWTAPVVLWHASRVRKRELGMAGKYDAVITAVPYIAGIFSKRVEQSRLHVIYNYTTLEPASTPSWEEKRWDAVYAGLINDSRCALEIVEAADVVRKHMPDFRMLLVGPSPDAHYRQKLAHRIKTLHLQENVILKEPVPFSEMEQLLLQSRVGLGLFKPIRLFQYGIQVKTFEYMACGLPVVCSHDGTIHDIVSHNACGISVDPSSAEETGQALIRMLTDRSLYLTCSRNGRKAVREKYNWAREERKLIAVYEKMLDT